MSGYNSLKKYVSGQVAVRQAFGQVGYGSKYGILIPDLKAWIADAMDLISRLKTYDYIPCTEYEVCDNRIELPNEMAIILCATANGVPMTYMENRGCNRVWENSVNRPGVCGCSRSEQKFWTDECYMHFNPALGNGVRICVDGLARPLDDEGFPMILETSILAVSEYICAKLCLRFRDNRYAEFKALWKEHCVRARAEQNQFSNQDVANLGFQWYTQPYRATFSAGWLGVGFTGGAIRG